jgi:hypothetical protein
VARDRPPNQARDAGAPALLPGAGETAGVPLVGPGRPDRDRAIGQVETEFSLVRFGGDEQRAAAVYEAVTPLSAEDVADCVAWAVTRPPHVNVDEIVVTARAPVLGFGQQIHRRE